MLEDYSVLMSVYARDNPKYLRESIESILAQTYPTNDFVIVADGSLTDDLENILNDYKESVNIYRLEHNSGLGAALNYGMKFCTNDLVARMDADDISLPNRCEKEIKAFENNPRLELIGSWIYEFVDGCDPHAVKKVPQSQQDIVSYARHRNPFNHPTVMYRKSCVERFGGYTEGRRGEDIALFTKMVFEGCVCTNIQEPLLLYRTGVNQYKRRTSLIDVKAVLGVARNNFRSHYISFFDLLVIYAFQIAGFVIPKKLGEKVFRSIFRTSVSEE